MDKADRRAPAYPELDVSEALQLADGSRIALDEHGHLCDRACWSPAVAEALAERDGVALTPAHWAVLMVLRDWFEEFRVEPPMRALLQRLRERTGDASHGSRDLYRLFPQGPVRQGSRYAGLPIPLSCI